MPSRMAFFRAFFSVDPAYAGMNLRMAQKVGLRMRGPRVCGDEPDIISHYVMSRKWTPRMRG